MKKKILLFFAFAALTLCITSCGKNDKPQVNDTLANLRQAVVEDTDESARSQDYSEDESVREENLAELESDAGSAVEATGEFSVPAYKMASIPCTDYDYVFALLFDDSYILDD